jgi:hypothetical protein
VCKRRKGGREGEPGMQDDIDHSYTVSINRERIRNTYVCTTWCSIEVILQHLSCYTYATCIVTYAATMRMLHAVTYGAALKALVCYDASQY